jgi:O-antigen ligase
MDRERLDKWLEWGILGFILAILVFGPVAWGCVRPQEFLILQALSLGIMLLWLIRLWLAPSLRVLWTPVCWAVVAFVVYAIIRYCQADIEYAARQELIRILLYAVLFFAVLDHLHRQESIQILSLTLIFLALGISAYAIYQFATDSQQVLHLLKPPVYMKRATGTYICPNHLAGFLEMILPLGLAFTLVGRIKPLTRVFVGYATLVILAGIGVSISRGGWIATGLALLFFFGVLIRYRSYRLPAIIALAILVSLGVLFVVKTQYTRKRFQDIFVNGSIENTRFRLWGPAVEMWRENPWWGIGPAHFDYRFRQYRPVDVQMRPDRVHNDYLNTLTDWGVVGVMLVASAWFLLFWGVVKTWKFVHRQSSEFSGKPSNRFTFVLGATTGLVAILLHSVVDFNMHIPANAILAVVLMALLTAHLRFASNGYWVSLRWLGRSGATILLLSGLVYLGYQEIRLYRESRWLQLAEKDRDYSPEKVDLLKKAAAIEPNNSATAYAIGEAVRIQSWRGDDGYEQLTQAAMKWFDQAIKHHPYDAYSYLRYGMCLDWLRRYPEAESYFKRALELDPNGYYMNAYKGWHLVQKGDYAGAKPWFERSLTLKPKDNPIATSYLAIINRRPSEPSGSK